MASNEHTDDESGESRPRLDPLAFTKLFEHWLHLTRITAIASLGFLVGCVASAPLPENPSSKLETVDELVVRRVSREGPKFVLLSLINDRYPDNRYLAAFEEVRTKLGAKDCRTTKCVHDKTIIGFFDNTPTQHRFKPECFCVAAFPKPIGDIVGLGAGYIRGAPLEMPYYEDYNKTFISPIDPLRDDAWKGKFFHEVMVLPKSNDCTPNPCGDLTRLPVRVVTEPTKMIPFGSGARKIVKIIQSQRKEKIVELVIFGYVRKR